MFFRITIHWIEGVMHIQYTSNQIENSGDTGYKSLTEKRGSILRIDTNIVQEIVYCRRVSACVLLKYRQNASLALIS